MRTYITMRDISLCHYEAQSKGREHNPYVIASALRTLLVLRAFSEPPHQLGLAEVVAKLGVERNQAYRSLKTLEAAAFLTLGENGRFELGPAAAEVASAIRRSESRSLVEVAAPLLDSLNEETRETVHLFIKTGDRAVCVDRRESPQSVRLVSVLGHSFPLHAGAAPKAILASLSAAERGQVLERLAELPRYTDRTELEPTRLEQELAEIAKRGFSVSDEDFDASARGVGAPILAADGKVVGGISLGGPSFRVDDALLAHFAQLVSAAADAITRQLALMGSN